MVQQRTYNINYLVKDRVHKKKAKIDLPLAERVNYEKKNSYFDWHYHGCNRRICGKFV